MDTSNVSIGKSIATNLNYFFLNRSLVTMHMDYLYPMVVTCLRMVWKNNNFLPQQTWDYIAPKFSLHLGSLASNCLCHLRALPVVLHCTNSGWEHARHCQRRLRVLMVIPVVYNIMFASYNIPVDK